MCPTPATRRCWPTATRSGSSPTGWRAAVSPAANGRCCTPHRASPTRAHRAISRRPTCCVPDSEGSGVNLTRPNAARTGVLRFVRHGATGPNLAGLRCGGDLDVPLAEAGREQALEIARHVAALDPPIGLIVTSDLRRTRATAACIA